MGFVGVVGSVSEVAHVRKALHRHDECYQKHMSIVQCVGFCGMHRPIPACLTLGVNGKNRSRVLRQALKKKEQKTRESAPFETMVGHIDHDNLRTMDKGESHGFHAGEEGDGVCLGTRSS